MAHLPPPTSSRRESACVGFDPAAIDLWRRTLCLPLLPPPIPLSHSGLWWMNIIYCEKGNEMVFVVLRLVNSTKCPHYQFSIKLSLQNNFGICTYFCHLVKSAVCFVPLIAWSDASSPIFQTGLASRVSNLPSAPSETKRIKTTVDGRRMVKGMRRGANT